MVTLQLAGLAMGMMPLTYWLFQFYTPGILLAAHLSQTDVIGLGMIGRSLWGPTWLFGFWLFLLIRTLWERHLLRRKRGLH